MPGFDPTRPALPMGRSQDYHHHAPPLGTIEPDIDIQLFRQDCDDPRQLQHICGAAKGDNFLSKLVEPAEGHVSESVKFAVDSFTPPSATGDRRITQVKLAHPSIWSRLLLLIRQNQKAISTESDAARIHVAHPLAHPSR